MSDNLLFVGTPADKEYLPYLKGCVGGATTFLRLDKITTLTELTMYCDKRNITGVISTSIPLLKKLLNWNKTKAPALTNYSGSLFTHKNLEIVFVNPLKHVITVPYGKFLLRRYCDKLVRKDKWFPDVPFTWNVAQPETLEDDFERLHSAILIGIDDETFKDNARIRCVSFCGIYANADGSLYSHATVIPLDSVFNLFWFRKFCWHLKAPKVFQNGKYDLNYHLRYNAPTYGYYFDTANLMHSWYSELPKDLGNLSAFSIRKSMYWKDMSETTDLYEYYHYNALDTYATAIACMALILEMPQWAKDNYYLEFPNVFPCILAEMTGIKRDMDRLYKARAEQDKIDEELTARLRTILGAPGFNPASSQQCLLVLKMLGCKNFKSADEKHLKKASYMHPFNNRIIDLILKIRKARTLKSKYLQVGENAKEFHGRILFALNPHGTDTSRLASKEHHFWCGLQIQNQPRGPLVKQTYVADDDFYIAEADLAQAESRDTAYISGDANLIDAVENSPDFHSSNASEFFGTPFEEIYDVETGKVINKPLRQIGKPVNHGANYNMGAYMLLEEMGEKLVIKARNLLGLPKVWSLKEVCEYLLEQFHKTYPGIAGTMYKGIISEIRTTKMLVSKAVHHPFKCNTGLHSLVVEEDSITENNYESIRRDNPSWTRYCFGDPTKSKLILNAYVAHPPQSLNAQTLNKAWLRVFFEIAINPKYADNFKLCAQVHDSILFQYRRGHDYLCQKVKECMEIPVTIKAYDDKIRTFTVPCDIKDGKYDGTVFKPAKYWSETE